MNRSLRTPPQRMSVCMSVITLSTVATATPANITVV